MVSWLMEQLLDWVAQRLLDVLAWVMGLLASTAFVVPNVAALPQVQAVWARNLAIVNTAYLLGVIAAGVVAMTHETVQVRYSVKQLLPRVVFGAVAANFSLTWCAQLFTLADAATRAVAGQPLVDTGSVRVVRDHVVAALTRPEVALLSLIVAAVALVLLFILLFQWIMRFAVLLVLTVAGPFALACYCLPGLDQVAGLWWRTLAGVLTTHLLQALTLYTGMYILVSPDAQLPGMLPLGGGQTITLLVLLVLLLACVKTPTLVRRYLLRGPAGSGARVLGVLLLQQVTRRLPTSTATRTTGVGRGGGQRQPAARGRTGTGAARR